MTRDTSATATHDTQAVIEAAREHADPFTLDPTVLQTHVFVVPNGATLQTVKPDDKYLDVPRRTTGSVTVEDTASLLAYVDRFHNEARTTAWVSMAGHRVVAILDDADAEAPAWRDHRATLQLVKTPEWTRWRTSDGDLMGQEAFARLIEMSEHVIANPDGATLLEMAQSFYATTSSEFGSGQRLQSGETTLVHNVTMNAGAGAKGEITIPKAFELHISPFHGEQPVTVTALLRYRIRDGKLALGYELVRPDDVERAVMQTIALAVREKVARTYLGQP